MTWVLCLSRRFAIPMFLLAALLSGFSIAWCADDGANKALEELEKALGPTQ